MKYIIEVKIGYTQFLLVLFRYISQKINEIWLDCLMASIAVNC